MSDSMIERVAAAICGEASSRASSDNQKERFRGQARDAIVAIREPTDAMLGAGQDVHAGLSDERYDNGAGGSWSAMINAALAEKA